MYRVLFVDDDEAIGFLVARYRIWKTAGFELADLHTTAEKRWKSCPQEALI